MVERYHLRYFLAVVDTGNFSRAAAHCNVSQPTLSVGIAKLEASLGGQLFRRSNRRVELTDAGTRLLARARAIEAEFASAERELAGAGSVRTVRIGVLATVPRRCIEEFLLARRFAADAERIEIVEGRESDLRSRLARGRIDLAVTIVRGGDPEAPVLTEGYSLALPASHPLASRSRLSVADIANEPMIVRRHCEMLAETSRFFTAAGVRPFFASRTTSDDRALGYVRAGLGITVMPDGFRDGGVARVPLAGFDVTRAIGLVYAPHADARGLEASETIRALKAALSRDEAG